MEDPEAWRALLGSYYSCIAKKLWYVIEDGDTEDRFVVYFGGELIGLGGDPGWRTRYGEWFLSVLLEEMSNSGALNPHDEAWGRGTLSRRGSRPIKVLTRGVCEVSKWRWPKSAGGGVCHPRQAIQLLTTYWWGPTICLSLYLSAGGLKNSGANGCDLTELIIF